MALKTPGLGFQVEGLLREGPLEGTLNLIPLDPDIYIYIYIESSPPKNP